MKRAAWLAAAWCVLAGAPRGTARAAEGRVIVTFQEGTTPEERARILRRQGLRVVEDFDPIPGAAAEPLPSVQAFGGPASAASLGRDPKILYVETDFHAKWIEESALPPLPSVGAVIAQASSHEGGHAGGWALSAPVPAAPDVHRDQVPWGIERVKAPRAWRRTHGSGVKVAVVDTGIAPHPDLRIAGGYDARLFRSDWKDDNGHGTHVAGTIAAAMDQQGVVGVAPGVRLYAVKVLDKDGGGMATTIVRGISWAVKNDMDVVNMSLGSDMPFFLMHWAVQLAEARGVTVVAAAGNSGGSVGYPAGYPQVIAVAASDPRDALASFSSRGPQVAFIAPGVDVRSTLPGGEYGEYSGTSMATPHVAGLAALAVSLGAQGPREVRAMLRAAATPLPGLTREQQGYGMIDAARLAGTLEAEPPAVAALSKPAR